MVPSRVLPMIASSEERTMAARSVFALSASLRAVMSLTIAVKRGPSSGLPRPPVTARAGHLVPSGHELHPVPAEVPCAGRDEAVQGSAMRIVEAFGQEDPERCALRSTLI